MAHGGTTTAGITGANRTRHDGAHSGDAHPDDAHGDDDTVSVPGAGARPVALALGLAGSAALVVWFAWRLSHPLFHPVAIVFLFCELLGVAGGIVIAVGLGTAGERRHVFDDEPPDSHWFALAVADLVGRTRLADLHREVRTAPRAAPFWRWRDSADAAIAAVIVEGPRRLLVVLAVSLGLLLGQSPFPAPPWWVALLAVAGYASLGLCLVVLGRRRVRVGDRLRWSYGAIGEVVARTDVAGHAPRRWVGSMAITVGVSVALALRGMSDRWTHGLAPMDRADRVTLMVIALWLVLGALYTIHTSPHPDPSDPNLVIRRHDEGTVRQFLLTAAVVVGVVGLIAGVLPDRSEPTPPLDGRAPAVVSAEVPGG